MTGSQYINTAHGIVYVARELQTYDTNIFNQKRLIPNVHVAHTNFIRHNRICIMHSHYTDNTHTHIYSHCVRYMLHTHMRAYAYTHTQAHIHGRIHTASEVIILFFLAERNTAFRVSISRIVLSSYDDDDVRRITRHILIQFLQQPSFAHFFIIFFSLLLILNIHIISFHLGFAPSLQ